MAISQKIIFEIASLVGEKNVITSEAERWCYAYDSTDLTAVPDLVVFPGNAEEISAIVKLANEHRFPVVPRGAGTGRAGGSVPVQGGVVLVLTRLNRILEISRDDLVAVVEPGVITGHLKRAVEEQGLYYPPDPGSADYCTIGGNVATGAGGAVAVQYGVTRDYVLGLTVVLPTGEIIDCGSRTMKGVVGYDMTRLFLGSEGTLGVIVKIMLRLVPKPPSRRTLAAGFASPEDATGAVGQILKSGLTPTAIEFLDRPTLDCIRDMLPFAIPASVEILILIALDGHPHDVAERAARMARLCKDQGARPLVRAKDTGEAERLWGARRAISPATFKVKPHKIAEDVAVPLSAIPALVAEVQEISRRRGLPIICFGHAGDGNIHVNVMYDRAVDQERLAAPQAVKDLFLLVRRLQGTLSGEHGVGLAKAPYIGMELSNKAIALQKRLKLAFDPHNIMNPGKIFPPAGIQQTED
jgi:glycolate oxidase